MMRRCFLFGIFLTSLSALLFEISLTKIFSVTLWYHFAYFVVSLALFGIGFGGLVAFFFEEFFRRRMPRALAYGALAQGLCMALCLAIVMNVPLKFGFSLSGIKNILLTYLVCAPPFVLTGLVISLAIRHRHENVAMIYAWDLAGSALGCVAFLLAISLVSGPAVTLMASFLAAAAAAMSFAAGNFSRRALETMALAVCAGAGVITICNMTTRFFDVKFAKAYEEQPSLLYERWSPLARITVYPGIFWWDDPGRPFGWGMSAKFKSDKPFKQLWIEQDASAGTPITKFDGDFAKVQFLKYDVTAFPYHIKPKAKTFVIGAGGGRDVLTALMFGAPRVVACEINPVTVGVVRDRFNDFAGGLYRRPDVEVVVADARACIRRSSESFDIIQMSLTDSWAATAAGAFTMTENSLYTVEAFEDYYRHLSEDGLLSVSRFLFKPPCQSLRAAIVARRALERLGVGQPERHIAVVVTKRENVPAEVATILSKRMPFKPEELQRIEETANEYGFEILYLPGRAQNNPDFKAGIETRPLEDFLGRSYLDLRPTTDDRPFFFQMIYLKNVADIFIKRQAIGGQWYNYYSQAVLVALLLISALLVAAFYIAPLVVLRKAQALPWGWGAYFILLGLGFMFVEIPMIQKGALYLGHPAYSLSVSLFSMLLFSGLGSAWSGRIGMDRLAGRLRTHLLAIAVIVAAATGALEWIVPHTIALPLSARIAIIIALTGAMAFLMGTAFPSGVRLLGVSREASIPWVWALNGGASVLGSILAMIVSMNYGYRYTMILGAVAYLMAVGIPLTQAIKPTQK
ncbi:MAG: hypothetical protein NTX50_06270 [Candidatus Sumerlaeota bacterium]|nr:hypothetical protein [Candidatus Sumerlaeota bacterium]